MDLLYNLKELLSSYFLFFCNFLLTMQHFCVIVVLRNEEVVNLKDRLKKIRKELDLTQQAFANKLGVKRDNIAGYETGKRNPSDAVISLICREFNVNETWLREGTGEMFIEMDVEDELMEWAGKVLSGRDSKFKKRFVTMLMRLSEEEWKLLEEKARELVEDSE